MAYHRIRVARAARDFPVIRLHPGIPDGDPARIIDKALTLLLADVKRKKFAKTARPRSESKDARKAERPNTSRHIPAVIKREELVPGPVAGARWELVPEPVGGAK